MSCYGLPAWLDCSPEAQAARLRQLQALQAKAYSGVSSIADRGRSVSYRDYAAMEPLIEQLQMEINACATGVWPRRRSLSYIDQVKGL
jgi:hypothetical protein